MVWVSLRPPSKTMLFLPTLIGRFVSFCIWSFHLLAIIIYTRSYICVRNKTHGKVEGNTNGGMYIQYKCSGLCCVAFLHSNCIVLGG